MADNPAISSEANAVLASLIEATKATTDALAGLVSSLQEAARGATTALTALSTAVRTATSSITVSQPTAAPSPAGSPAAPTPTLAAKDQTRLDTTPLAGALARLTTAANLFTEALIRVTSLLQFGVITTTQALANFTQQLNAGVKGQAKDKDKDKSYDKFEGALTEILEKAFGNVTQTGATPTATPTATPAATPTATPASATPGPTPAKEEEKEPTAGVGGALGELVGVYEKLALAIGGVILVAKVFTEALSPGVVLLFNAALRDLMATVGVALLPVIQVATDAFRQIAAILLPVMEQLAPIVRTLVQSIADRFIPEIQLFAQIITTLIPIFNALAGLTQIFAIGARVVTSILAGVVEGLRAFFTALFPGFDLGAEIKNIVDGFKTLAHYILLVIGSLAALFGLTNFLNGLIKGLEGGERKSAVGLAAPQNAAIKGLADIGKDLALAAAVAGAGGEGPKSQEDYLKEAIEELKKIRDGKYTEQQIRDWLKQLASDIAGEMFVKFGKSTYEKGKIGFDLATSPNFLPLVLRGLFS
jgi:hypothetical protein